MIGNVNVRLERFRHGNLHLATRLYFLAALGKADVKNGNLCAVVRLVDCRNRSPAFLAVGCVSFCFQHGVVFKRAVRGNAAFGSQFVCSSVFVTASDQRKTQRENKRKCKEN